MGRLSDLFELVIEFFTRLNYALLAGLHALLAAIDRTAALSAACHTRCCVRPHPVSGTDRGD
ncbi:hypothetical protein [Methanocella arvoryzae]|uniref:hypothetical protein n=1 Tax=Methanocella arvoryzae TaxID=1175445 RepID=UPI0003268B5A|nr:hypothetical protein [Methanocella arvoryzae]